MRARTAECVRRADVALLLLDGAVGATGDDDAVGRWLRRRAGDVPRVVAFNKCEDGRDVSGADREVAARHADVGPLLVSATHGDGLPDLLDALRGFGAAANSAHDDGDAAPAVRVALVGRPNARRRAHRRFFSVAPGGDAVDARDRVPQAGKSTLLNALARSAAATTAREAGVTRDAVEARATVRGRAVTVVDTAGAAARDAATGADALARAAARAAAFEAARCDVAALCVDASTRPTRDDLRLARRLVDARVPVVVVATKLDLVRATARDVERGLRASPLRFLFDAADPPVVACSAVQAPARARRALALAVQTRDAHVERRIATGPLNAWLADVKRGPGGERLAAVRYAAQVATDPPTFALFGRGLGAALGPARRDRLASAIARDLGFRGARVAVVLRGDPVRRLRRQPARS